MAGKRNPTAVWIVRRKGKRGTSYRLRWIDPRSSKWASEACGRDLAYARARRDQVKQELRDGLAGKLPETTVSELADRLDSLMAGRSEATIERTKESLKSLEDLCGSMLVRFCLINRRLETRLPRNATRGAENGVLIPPADAPGHLSDRA